MGYLITFVIGISVLVASLHFFSQTIHLHLIKTGTRTLAVVEEIVQERSKKGKYTYRPIFRFTTMNGQDVHYRYGIASSPPDWQLGEKATVVYQIENPENPTVLTYFGAFGWAIILLVIAVGLLIVSGGNYVFQYYMRPYLL